MSIKPSCISLSCTFSIYECCTPSSKSSGLGSSVSTSIPSEGNSFPAFSIGITCAAATSTSVDELSTATVVSVTTLLALFPDIDTPIIAANATTPMTPPAIIFLLLSMSCIVSTLSFTLRKNSFFFFLLIFSSLSKFICSLLNILPILQTPLK